MKGIVVIFFLLFNFTSSYELCRVGRIKSSKIIENEDNLIFLKGYFIPNDGSRLAKFKVQTSNSGIYEQYES